MQQKNPLPPFQWLIERETTKLDKEQIYNTLQKSKHILTSMLSDTVHMIQCNKAHNWKGANSYPTWGSSSHPAKPVLKLYKLLAIRHGFMTMLELCG